MPRDIVVSDYSYETLRKEDVSGTDGGGLMSNDRIGEAFFGRFGDRASTEVARNRLFWIAQQVRGEAVLDVGTSEGILPILLAREGFTVAGIDVSSRAIDYARQLTAAEPPSVAGRVSYQTIDFFTFVRGKTFDTIIAGEVIEHLVSAPRFLDLCAEHLSAEGRLVLTTPFGVHPDPDHKASYFLSDIVRLASPMLEIRSLGVVDGYIRLVADKRSARAGATGTQKGEDLRFLDAPALTRLLLDTEAATHAAQTKSLRLLDERRRQLRDTSDWVRSAHEERDVFKAEAEAAASGSAALQEAVLGLDRTVGELRERLSATEAERERQGERAQAATAGLANARAENAALADRLKTAQTALDAAKRTAGELEQAASERRQDMLFARTRLSSWMTERTDPSARQVLTNVAEPGVIRLGKKPVAFSALVEPGANYRLEVDFADGFAPREAKLALVMARFLRDDGTEIDAPYATLSHSRIGAYRYFGAVEAPARTLVIPFRAPPEARRASLALRRWLDRQPVAVLNALRLVRADTGPSETDLKAVLARLDRPSLPTAPLSAPTALSAKGPVAAARPATVVEERPTPPLLKAAPSAGPKRLKALYVLDEISMASWGTSLDLIALRREAADHLLETSGADFVFLESCWKGNGGDWEHAFTSPNLAHANARALTDAIGRVRAKGLPLVFWNKEDPMHFDRFLPIAEKADIVLTTDSNKVPDYERAIPGTRVEVMPFAALPSICNPVDRSRIKPETVCFAGAFYPEHHDERVRQMDFVLPAVEAFGGAIYDRYSHLDTDRYRFPARYLPFVRPSVPFKEITNVYKRFKVFLNVNTIVDSPTMMSRRVYELLASGTPVVSAPSAAIDEQFDGLVATGSTEREIVQQVGALLEDDTHWHRTAHRGLREVVTKHTYAQRTERLRAVLGRQAPSRSPLVSIIVASCRPKNVTRTIENVTRQIHPRCEVIYAVTPNFTQNDREALASVAIRSKTIERAEVIVLAEDVSLGRCLNEAVRASRGEFIAKFDDDNIYLEHYLSDLLFPFEYDDYDIVGKESYFCYLGGIDKLIWRNPEKHQRTTKFVAGDAMIMRRRVFERTAFPEKRVGEDTKLLKDVVAYGGKIYSADHFNFVKYRSADLSEHTWRETEEKLLRQSVEIAAGLDLKPVRI